VRYGMNPHQRARLVAEPAHVRVLSGELSMINWLDALNAWQLVREAAGLVGKPVATSFKHVSPAGVAAAGPIDDCAAGLWRVERSDDQSLLSAYVRARDVDPKSSFGDVVALSEPCDLETAHFLASVVSDVVIAPGFEDGAMSLLSAKKRGRFIVLEADSDYEPPAWEHRSVFGVDLEQEHDHAPLDGISVPDDLRGDVLLGLVTLRYTQSNSVCVGKQGMVLGIGAGQQNRVDCTRLAGHKAQTWALRRHPRVRDLLSDSLARQDLVNWHIRFAERSLTRSQEGQLGKIFGMIALETYRAVDWREDYLSTFRDLVMCSDGFLPFRDNVDAAAELGIVAIAEPGGSMRTAEVHEAATEHSIRHLITPLRLFHH
jgi:phosphoribosylaminoimidazolecarboxamide formyltransferase / IMP cyclohydrolase